MNKLLNLYREIRNYEKDLVRPCLITKDTDSAFELWLSKGNSSVFFSSLTLFQDHITIKFNPHIIKGTYDYYPNPPKSSYEYQLREMDISKNTNGDLKKTILDLVLFSKNKSNI